MVGMPCIIVFNLIVTPVYMLSLIFTLSGIRRSSITGRFWIIAMIIIFFILLYAAIPIVFFMVTIP